MKHMKRILAAVLAAAMTLVLVACVQSDKVEAQIYDYLEGKYEGYDFEILSYTQEKDTSGRYAVSVHCADNDVDFEIYASSILVTDDFTVKYANSVMESDLIELLGTARPLICVKSIQWLDLYADDSNGYKFREFPLEEIPYTPYDVKNIYRVKLDDMPSSNEAAQCIYMFCDILDYKGVSLDKVTFEFKLADEPIIFTTNTKTALKASFSVLETLFERSKSEEEEGNLFYRNPESKIKTIEYFLP